MLEQEPAAGQPFDQGQLNAVRQRVDEASAPGADNTLSTIPTEGLNEVDHDLLPPAVEELWPEAPHQVCQFHALRDASQSAFEADKQVKTAMRKHMQPKVRAVRKQLKKQIPEASAEEASQLAVLDDYASGIVTALNIDGLQPFKYATMEAAPALDEVEASLQQLEKRGVQSARGSRRKWLASR